VIRDALPVCLTSCVTMQCLLVCTVKLTVATYIITIHLHSVVRLFVARYDLNCVESAVKLQPTKQPFYGIRPIVFFCYRELRVHRQETGTHRDQILVQLCWQQVMMIVRRGSASI